MPDIIHLLTDSVANQIAAGEVIQRPASVVKELLENAVDSGADEITLVIKDAGKVLVQVIDNGCAMSVTDARMCFERHATSKIKSADDLFAIHTLGFRGEALASIASIAQVELKTQRVEDETGTHIIIEGSKVVSQDVFAGTKGTSISVKNLFYNIPARRKFLKSNSTELRHIIEEFQRVVLVRPGIKFTFHNDNRQLFLLPKGNLKQRIVALFGPTYNNKLIPLEQESDVVTISGFIGKPEFARKTRGEQYFFVNGRFIKHHYLNHAVDGAFRELIPNDAFPSYFIYFKIDPKEIDINIHPTKTEVNFQNNQVIYAMLSSTVKQALGKFNISPSIDFGSESSFEISMPAKDKVILPPSIAVNTEYNPFEKAKRQTEGAGAGFSKPSAKNWESLYPSNQISKQKAPEQKFDLDTRDEKEIIETDTMEGAFLLRDHYVVARVHSGLMLIDRQRAMERIYFEQFLSTMEAGRGNSQQTLFPLTLHYSSQESEILKFIEKDLKKLGFEIEYFGNNSFIVHGTPAELNNPDTKDVLDSIIDNVKKSQDEVKIDRKSVIAKQLAVNMAFRHKGKLEKEEIKSLINRLFATKVPEVTPNGKPIVKIMSFEEIDQKF
ncbi:MAG: DNA mismatch repair endonuclease MutL [Bacteroidales bacterium]